MATEKKSTCPKIGHQKVGFEKKLLIIEEIQNGLISVNHASEVYGISRSTINYWIEKLSNFTQTRKSMSLKEENKKLRERIEALEFIKELQQDIIVDFEKVTGQELSKKYLPETLANEIAKKKKKHTK
jgi:transposase-like protein